MFEFVKNKKGFTLVELMIVVVIMAILVAVAVPIFSAVTKNARIKTCAANRREIVSQVNGFLMGNVDGKQHTATGSYIITSDGNAATGLTVGSGSATEYTEEMFKGLFQEVPYCPAGGTYEVTISYDGSDGINESTATVSVTCSGGTDSGEHE